MFFGQIHFESAQLGSEGIECVNLGFGSGWNEGSPTTRLRSDPRTGTPHGHVPEGTHTKLSASCRPETTGKPGSFITDEAYVKSEENGSKEVEASSAKAEHAWNVEAAAVCREEEYVPILKIGVPTSEFPKARRSARKTSKPGQTKRKYELNEGTRKKEGCYATNPAPEGCIRLTIVEPGAGLEVAFGGTLRAHFENGVKNGLFPSKWHFEGATSGALQCEFPSVAPRRVSGPA